ncbi:hypothetical protein TSC_c12570 [Thermus scotoductus SA-01]|uniref:Uncharacterized protein n=1 Tax=Thermus scotoductus (strain ATCC 700910 / SA-01) TaxID=743525 RepID=E8PQU5_THESS|nr:hypothetical protein TSC_c12570 [Thermus scotoductus SA-01]ETN89361.1 hypothetical protein TNMX_02085 [Thermus sp. NMX2.A1]
MRREKWRVARLGVGLSLEKIYESVELGTSFQADLGAR